MSAAYGAFAPHRCVRYARLLPEGVRDFFLSFLAAKQACVPFEDFKDAMEDRDETRASRNGQWPPSVPSS